MLAMLRRVIAEIIQCAFMSFEWNTLNNFLNKTKSSFTQQKRTIMKTKKKPFKRVHLIN